MLARVLANPREVDWRAWVTRCIVHTNYHVVFVVKCIIVNTKYKQCIIVHTNYAVFVIKCIVIQNINNLW